MHKQCDIRAIRDFFWLHPHVYLCEVYGMSWMSNHVKRNPRQAGRLTTRKPCRAFHLSCTSPAAPQCGGASACGRCWPPSSDLKTGKKGEQEGKKREVSPHDSKTITLFIEHRRSPIYSITEDKVHLLENCER